eukprot:jgi/Tetstr1/460709/TSEL_005896.t1
MWQHLAEGRLSAYDQPQTVEAAVDQPAATPADSLARADKYHTEPKLLRVGDDNLCAISPGKEDEAEFADTLRLAVALTSPIALLRAARPRTIVIYLSTECDFDHSELLIHPYRPTV